MDIKQFVIDNLGKEIVTTFPGDIQISAMIIGGDDNCILVAAYEDVSGWMWFYPYEILSETDGELRNVTMIHSPLNVYGYWLCIDDIKIVDHG